MNNRILGNTDRSISPVGLGCMGPVSYTHLKDAVRFSVTVENTGDAPGKEVVQVYCEAPQGKLGKPARTLCAFGKTSLLAPGERETLTLTAAFGAFSSYDDSGVTGHKSCWILEAGTYRFYLGTDVRLSLIHIFPASSVRPVPGRRPALRLRL